MFNGKPQARDVHLVATAKSDSHANSHPISSSTASSKHCRAPKHGWNIAFKADKVGPFVLDHFTPGEGSWKGDAEPVYDPNQRCLTVYAPLAEKSKVNEMSSALLQGLKVSVKKRTEKLVLQTGTIEVEFGYGLKHTSIDRVSSNATLRQVALQTGMIARDKYDAEAELQKLGINPVHVEHHGKTMSSFVTDTLEAAAVAREKMKKLGGTKPPKPCFSVKLTNGADKWDGEPCYAKLYRLAPNEKQAVLQWCKKTHPDVSTTLTKDSLEVLVPTAAQAKALLQVYTANMQSLSSIEFCFDNPDAADTLTKYKGAVTMSSAARLDWMKYKHDPLGRARKIAEDAGRKFLVAMQVGDPQPKTKRCEVWLSCGLPGGAMKCLHANTYATKAWQDHRITVTGRLMRFYVERSLATGSLKDLADKAKMVVPKVLPAGDPYLGVKGSDEGFGQLLFEFGEEYDRMLPHLAVCSISATLAKELEEKNWALEMCKKHGDAHVQVERDCVCVFAPVPGRRDAIVDALNSLRKRHRLSTNDDHHCACGESSARRLALCGHPACDNCIISGPSCPHKDCDGRLCVQDLHVGEGLDKGLAVRILHASLRRASKDSKYGVCPMSDCTAILAKKKKPAACLICGEVVCVACQVQNEHHEGKTCEEYKAYLKQHGPCPECSTMLQLSEGAQMCTKCSTSVCSVCGLVNAANKGHVGNTCKDYRKGLEYPLEWLFAEAEQFAKDRLMEEQLPNFQFYPNLCVQKPGCPAIDKFIKAGGAGKVFRKTMGHFGWHGTRSVDAISAICCEGWDPTRRSGQVYGPGEYFAYKAQTSRGYASSTNILMVAFILEGEWLNKTTHMVVNNPLDGRCAFVVPVGVVCWSAKLPLRKCCLTHTTTEPATCLWEWQDDNQWKQYPDNMLAGIEAAFVRHSLGGSSVCTVDPVSLKLDRRQEYEINFSEMKQRNTTTGYERKVRRQQMQRVQSKYLACVSCGLQHIYLL